MTVRVTTLKGPGAGLYYTRELRPELNQELGSYYTRDDEPVGRTNGEIVRCLKRYIAREIFKVLPRSELTS